MRDWLKQIRIEQKLTLSDAADKCGISQNYLFYIETGERGDKLPVQTAKKIAEALGFDWQRFYENEPA